jgi:hypothetical protein
MTTTTCGHQERVQYLVRLSATERHTSVATDLARKMTADELVAQCQVECGAGSPYRDVTPTPLSHDEAARILNPRNGLDVLVDEFAEALRAARRGIQRLLRRPTRP